MMCQTEYHMEMSETLKYSQLVLMKTHAAVIVFSFVPPAAHSSSLPPGS